MSFHSIIANAQATIRSVTGIKVTYTRDDQSVQVLATPTGQLQSSDAQDEFIQDSNTRDWLITASVLVLGGQSVEPEVNDTITEVIGGKVYTYEVCIPSGEQAWSYTGTGRSEFRIHTKLRDVANV